MKITRLAGVLTALLVANTSAQAGDDLSIERLALCRDSWLDWKDDFVQRRKFSDSFQLHFARRDNDPFFVPRVSQTVIGLPLAQVFPESLGMGVGFSLVVNATFDATRRNLEKEIAKSLKNCDTSDNMRTCDLEIGEKKTIVLMAGDSPKSTTTLFGCYYYYEK